MNYKFLDSKGEHLHVLDDKPLIGTSTVVGVLSKPLTWWASGLACTELGWVKKADPRKATEEEITTNLLERSSKAAAMLQTYEKMTAPEYLALLDKAYAAHANSLKKSATKGTDMHEELEKYVKLMIADQGGVPHLMNGYEHKAVEIFAKWATEKVKRFIVSEGHCFSERLWTGGIVDCVFEDKQGLIGIMDFKSSKEAYLSQFIQTGGYDIEISENGVFDKEGKLIYKLERPIDYYSIFPFGMENPEPQFNFDVEAVKKGFEAAVVLYKLINK